MFWLVDPLFLKDNMNTSNIQTGKPISKRLSKAIREFISESDYDKVASICGGSRSTLRQVIYGYSNVTDGNKKAVETLMRFGVQYSQSNEANRQILIDALNECESEALQKLNEVL